MPIGPPDSRVRRILRGLHAAAVLCIVGGIVVPALPWQVPGRAALVEALSKLSLSQRWQMYAPDPMRSYAFMNITAEYEDGTRAELEETLQEQSGWTQSHFFWTKTRVDIWREYANFLPKNRSHDRIWYLRSACVREARTGNLPYKLVMHRVERRFTPPERVREGAPALGEPKKTLVTVQYCRAPQVLAMIEADRARQQERDP